MEEKERYKWSQDVIVDCAYEDYDCIVDTKNNIIFNDDNYFKLINILNQQDKRIKELEEENTYFRKEMLRDGETFTLSQAKVIDEIRKENQQFNQQLHDLPKQIVEDITNELSNNTSLYFEMRESTSAHCPNKEYEWFNYVRFRDYINAILQKYGGENE